MKKRTIGAAVLIGLALAGLASATDVASLYNKAFQGWHRDLATSDAADPGADTAYATSATIEFKGRQTVTLSPRTSVAGATIKLGLWRGNLVGGAGTAFKPASFAETGSIASNSSYTIGGKYVVPSVAFDTAGYDFGYVVVESISTGNVTVDVSVH